jgi:capsid assembly protease
MEFLAHIADAALNQPLALLPKKAAILAAVLGQRVGLTGDMGSFVRSVSGPPMARRAPSQSASGGYIKTSRGVAVISIVGSLVPRAGYLEAESGLLSYERLKSQVRMADQDGDVTSIVLDIHSAGGAVAGCFECAEVVHEVSRRRPIVAVANSMCCSAAFAIAAAANQVVVTPTSTIGSIGVVMVHADFSRQIEAKGITPTIFVSGAHKADGNELQPLSDDVKDEIQREIDACMDLFVSSVLKHRPNLTEKVVRDTEARVFMGAQGVSIGLADKIGTIESVIADLGKLHPVAQTKYDLTERLYGKVEANFQRLQDAHARGVRAGMAAALAGKTDVR